MEDVNNSRFAGKKVAVVVALLAVALSTTAALLLQQPALGQNQSSNATSSTIPNLNGSVSIQNATNDFIKENVKVSFTDAANTAQGQVDNGVVVGGRLTAVQGYLAYTFNIANYDADTSRIVIVDAGNSNVLYTADEMPLHYGGFGGFGCGSHGGFGHWGGMAKDMTSSRSGVDTTSA
jgi:uncharacterized membrane protein YkoI